MNLRQSIWLLPLALGVSLTATADTLDINLSGDAAKISFIRPLPPEGLEAGAGVLRHNDDGEILEAELHLVDRPEPGRDALVLGIGGKLPLVMDDARDADGSALAIGGKLRWTLPNYNRAAVAGSLYYAPSATSLSDLDGYEEYSLRGEFQILEDANVYLGYRHIELSYDGDGFGADREFEEGIYAGFNVNF